MMNLNLDENIAYLLYKYAKGYKYELNPRDYLKMAQFIIDELGIKEYDFPAPIMKEANTFVKVYRITSMEQ